MFLRRVCLAILIFNSIYISFHGLRYKDNTRSNVKALQHLNIDYDSDNTNAQLSTTSINYTEQLQFLFEDVAKNADNRYWSIQTKLTANEVTINPYLFMNDTKARRAWRNQNTLFQDPRVTLALYLNYIRRQFDSKGVSDVSVPFHWADWVDLTFLNKDLAKSGTRNQCDWLKQFSERSFARNFKCVNNEEITDEQIQQMGFERREQLPGYIQFDHTEPRGTNKIRLAQAKSYVLSFMPNPYKLLFLNLAGGTYEVDVAPERQRIVTTGLMNEYGIPKGKVTKFIRKSLTLNPAEEFAAMKKNITPSKLDSDPEQLAVMDPHHLYTLVHSNAINNKSLALPMSSFRYGETNISSQIEHYQSLEAERNLSQTERGFLESLQLSQAADSEHEYTYFKQSTLVVGDERNRGNDPGWHYDWRFFNGGLKYKRNGWNEQELDVRTGIILERLLRNWFRFTQEKGFASWVMHGLLLSWYWNGLMFPFDNDIDVQMPVEDLVRLGEYYNQTLVIEDVNEGYGKFLVDVGTFIHNRDISKQANHIDARFIDVDTGIYIDITGLSVSEASIPEEYTNTELFSPNGDYVSINDRRKHFYTHEQLSPLKYTMLSGIPAHIPNQITKRLRFEYPSGLARAEFANWFFIPRLRLWLKREQLTAVLDDNDTRFYNPRHDPIYDNDKIMSVVLEITDEELYKLFESDPTLLGEYYLTRDLTAFHEKEAGFLFDKQYNDQGEVSVEDKSFLEDLNSQYSELLSNIKYSQPLRKPLFQYEKYDQPKHHVETETK